MFGTVAIYYCRLYVLIFISTVSVDALLVYLTPAQKALFGSLPTKSIPEDTPPPSPSPKIPPNPSDASNAPDAPQELPKPPQPPNDARPDYLRVLQRAVRRRNGPLFLSTLETINSILRSLKYPPLPSDVFLPAPPNVLISAVRSWSYPRGIPDKVMLRIVDETYQRCVGPNIKNLHRYEAFSSEVYGELMPSFTSDIIAATGLNSNSLLMDLGSGVGNVLLQASLQTGCRSYGIELLEGPANVARQQWKQFQKRCRMWGVRTGDVELEEGDMLKSKRVSELMGKADVVLVNNKVFQQSRECRVESDSRASCLTDRRLFVVNEALRAKFLDLKEGAIVVSLKPFVAPNARVTERNVRDRSAGAIPCSYVLPTGRRYLRYIRRRRTSISVRECLVGKRWRDLLSASRRSCGLCKREAAIREFASEEC